MTRPPAPPSIRALEQPPDPAWEKARETPCATPPGGWRVIDAERTTSESLEQTIEVAKTLPGFAAVWLDKIKHPVVGAAPDDDPDDEDEGMDLPESVILNVAVTGDHGPANAGLRNTWGGALCVSGARYTLRELQRIQHTLAAQPGALTAGSFRDHVDLHVIYDDGSLQSSLDEKYPPGLVRVTSALQPYAPA
jgi:hypothetical protein